MMVGFGLARKLICVLALSNLSQALAEDDSQCLRAFKNSVKDPRDQLSSWKFSNTSAGSVCDFTGVTCWNPGENKVLAIKITNAGLEGTFPSGLSQCKALQILDLSHNSFIGPIPNDLCKQLPYLTSLNLGQNSVSGNIPFTLEDCKYLQSLDLQQNNLSGELPGGIGALERLTVLDVSSNQLTGPIPSSYANKAATSFSGNAGLCGPPLDKSCSKKRSNSGLIVGIIIAAAAVVACLCAIGMWYFIRQGRKKDIALAKDKHKWAKRIRAPKSVVVSLFETPLVKLKFSDLMAATNDFSKDNIIGEGWTGTVYKAILLDGSMLAVKRLRPSSLSDKEFRAEMDTLGRVRHRNLVPLLGYCSTGSEKLLVYKHMVSGTLRECLHDAHEDTKLDWITRLKIGIGVGRGLAQLHDSCNPRIIHCNISSNSILFDEEYEPRITNFGLARLMNPVDTHISAIVSCGFGDLGYVAPEYYRTLVATVKVDVFSFGVVLLELATRQRANNVCTDGGFKGNLSDWVSFLASHGRVEEALDMSLKGGGFDDEVNQFLRIACACVVWNPKERPTMYEVYQWLKAIGEKCNIIDD